GNQRPRVTQGLVDRVRRGVYQRGDGVGAPAVRLWHGLNPRRTELRYALAEATAPLSGDSEDSWSQQRGRDHGHPVRPAVRGRPGSDDCRVEEVLADLSPEPR